MSLNINKVWLEGEVRTHPRLRNLSQSTKLTAFTISVTERWASRTGEVREHKNVIPVEVLGKDAEDVHEALSPGDKVFIDGYIRSNQFQGRDVITIRAFRIGYEKKEKNGTEKSEGAPQEKLRISLNV